MTLANSTYGIFSLSSSRIQPWYVSMQINWSHADNSLHDCRFIAVGSFILEDGDMSHPRYSFGLETVHLHAQEHTTSQPDRHTTAICSLPPSSRALALSTSIRQVGRSYQYNRTNYSRFAGLTLYHIVSVHRAYARYFSPPAGSQTLNGRVRWAELGRILVESSLLYTLAGLVVLVTALTGSNASAAATGLVRDLQHRKPAAHLGFTPVDSPAGWDPV